VVASTLKQVRSLCFLSHGREGGGQRRQRYVDALDDELGVFDDRIAYPRESVEVDSEVSSSNTTHACTLGQHILLASFLVKYPNKFSVRVFVLFVWYVSHYPSCASRMGVGNPMRRQRCFERTLLHSCST